MDTPRDRPDTADHAPPVGAGRDPGPAALLDPVRDPVLDPVEVRVLGCLIEKESTTPDQYPLTLNALRHACNQSTSRDPVTAHDDHEIERALASLRARGLTRTVHSTSNRATKYRHVVPDVLALDRAGTAVLSVLLLRGAQTVGELKARTERQHRFDSTDEVAATLAALAEATLVARLERRPGQKDTRWVHVLGGPPGVGAGGDDHGRTANAARSAAQGGNGPGESATRPPDPYGEATAEFYDLLATGHWEAFGLQLLDLLADVDPTAGPVIDVGSGTGAGLAYLHAVVPTARLYAVEPSRSMRVALHTRLALDTELRAATTVDPRPLADADLPPRASALVASATLGHLGDVERDRLWRYVAEQMPAGAPAVIELLPPQRPVGIPMTRYREVAVGDFVYEGWQAGEPADDHHMLWTMTYRVIGPDGPVAEHVARSRWRCFTPDDVRAEVARHGLTVEEHPELVVIRRREPFR